MGALSQWKEGWQVSVGVLGGRNDPMWHVSSRSGVATFVATLRTAIRSLLTYLLTGF